MAKDDASNAPESSSQFSIELGTHDLTDAEISDLGNKITETIVNSIQSSTKAVERGKGPYARITFVKQIHSRTIRH
ncbi:MAG: hypothetical protein JWR11_5998 [Mycobacterium sp.]|jgi:hypothetical protein|nr:hypothetical protein [Mycobacterium sp.]MDT5176276.1 hypothetical protein [Mycobacterium sp.]